jgi:hypothetical protein
MSEQDECEKWLDDFKLKQQQRGFWNEFPSRREVWDAATQVERKRLDEVWYNVTKQQLDEKDKTIEQQAAEIEALREFANEVIDYNNLYLSNKNGFVDRYSKCYSLIDENGKPTSLLTGIKEL